MSALRRTASALTWKQDGYLHFAHGATGMWTIEQRRGKYYLTLDLPGTVHLDAAQDMGAYLSLAKAKSGAQRDHRALVKLA